MQFAPLGDRTVMITLGHSIDLATHRLLRAVSAQLDSTPPDGVVDQVPAFVSVAVHYDPIKVAGDPHLSPYERIVVALERSLSGLHVEQLPEPRHVEIPVCYGGDFGPDLDEVGHRHGLTADEVVRIHAGGDYLVYMVGFMPGFAYLGGLSEQIVTPRRASPRTAVTAGTVGIGGEQTGVYPLESPGGWNLIGRTPLEIFDAARAEATLISTGDRVTFRQITVAEFHAWTVAS
jgi:inhibitor of KinA